MSKKPVDRVTQDWPLKELDLLYNVLERNANLNPETLSKIIKTKSPDQVKKILNASKSVKVSTTSKGNLAELPNDNSSSGDAMDFWSQALWDMAPPHLNFSLEIINVLESIADSYDKPSSSSSPANEVDYGSIYRYLAALMRREPPARLVGMNSGVMLGILHSIMDDVRMACSPNDEEFLEQKALVQERAGHYLSACNQRKLTKTTEETLRSQFKLPTVEESALSGGKGLKIGANRISLHSLNPVNIPLKMMAPFQRIIDKEAAPLSPRKRPDLEEGPLLPGAVQSTSSKSSPKRRKKEKPQTPTWTPAPAASVSASVPGSKFEPSQPQVDAEDIIRKKMEASVVTIETVYVNVNEEGAPAVGNVQQRFLDGTPVEVVDITKFETVVDPSAVKTGQ